MKRITILIIAGLLLIGVLTACGEMDRTDKSTTSTTRSITEQRAEQPDERTTDRGMDDMLRDNAETVSEMFSEGASELRDNSFLDPENGRVSDTQPNE